MLNVNCPMCEKPTPIVDGTQQTCAHCQSDFTVQVSVAAVGARDGNSAHRSTQAPSEIQFPENRDFSPPPERHRSRVGSGVALGFGTAAVGAGVAGLLAIIAGLIAVVMFLGTIAYAFVHLVTLGWL